MAKRIELSKLQKFAPTKCLTLNVSEIEGYIGEGFYVFDRKENRIYYTPVSVEIELFDPPTLGLAISWYCLAIECGDKSPPIRVINDRID